MFRLAVKFSSVLRIRLWIGFGYIYVSVMFITLVRVQINGKEKDSFNTRILF